MFGKSGHRPTGGAPGKPPNVGSGVLPRGGGTGAGTQTRKACPERPEHAACEFAWLCANTGCHLLKRAAAERE